MTKAPLEPLALGGCPLCHRPFAGLLWPDKKWWRSFCSGCHLWFIVDENKNKVMFSVPGLGNCDWGDLQRFIKLRSFE